jgi:hypothetical protein
MIASPDLAEDVEQHARKAVRAKRETEAGPQKAARNARTSPTDDVRSCALAGEFILLAAAAGRVTMSVTPTEGERVDAGVLYWTLPRGGGFPSAA